MTETATSPILQLTRRFRSGATVLEDIDPQLSPEKVLEAYVPNYPYLRGATLSDPAVEGEFLVFTIVKPAVQTKGGRVDDAVEAMSGWANQVQCEASVISRWRPIFDKLQASVKNPATAILDPLYLPLL